MNSQLFATGGSFGPGNKLSPMVTRRSVFLPSDLLALQFWLNSADSSTITDNAGAVSQMDDASGNGNHATQSTENLKPKTGTHTINGHNVLDFDGAAAGDNLILPNTLGSTGLFCDAGESFTVQAVVSVDVSIAGSQMILTRSNNVSSSFIPFMLDTRGVTNDVRLLLRAAQTTIHNYTLGVPFLVTITWDGSTAKVYINDGSAATLTVGTAVELAVNIKIAALADTNSFTLDGQIAELLIYDVKLNDADRSRVTQYLLDKWINT